ncbi:DNA repair protein RadC [Candidatus Parcubacteria bacterium]|nr:DNA repair protein RadC [Candidatus Parcubacteria bacterium]
MQNSNSSTQTSLIKNMYQIAGNDLIIGDERKYVLRVKDLDEEDRPREKLKKRGPKALSAVELLAVVLATGTRKEEVMQMSARLIKEYGKKGVACQTDPKVLATELGIPETKACQIVACFELGRRFFNDSKNGRIVIRTAKQAFEYLKDMRELPKEQFRGIYLNSHYQIIHDEVISIGSLTSNIVHPREVFRPAVTYAAAAIIIAHNHPSGSVKPTASDIMVTEQLVQVGRIMGINILDHVIISGNKYLSIPIKYD